MMVFLAIVYGVHLAGILYLISYFTVRGVMRGGAAPLVLVLGKYLIYWAMIEFGFKRLPFWGIMAGFVGGIYLSLPILYWVNKKWVLGSSLEKSPD